MPWHTVYIDVKIGDCSVESRVKEIRNYLRAIPESGGYEEKTSSYLASALEKSGYEVTRNIGGYGVIGVLRGKDKGLIVGLRGDMDALSFMIDGKKTAVHACGHDANCAMVLAAAEKIAEKGIKKGALKIIFQPDEEGLNGAKKIVESGQVKDLEYLIGIHLRPIQEAKLGEATPSLVHGAATLVNGKIIGKVAHGARPHLGVNAIDAGAMVVNAVNGINEDPNKSWSAKTTKFVSDGLVTNAIPGGVALSFDLRAESNALMKSILEKVFDIVENLPKSIGAKGLIEYFGEVPGAEYDGEVVAILERAIKEAMGEKALLPPILTPGGDDFHFYKRLMPSLKTGYVGIGADLTPGLHDPDMKFNDEALPNGVKIIVKAMEILLN